MLLLLTVRLVYLSASFWSIYAEFPHVVVAVQNAKDAHFVRYFYDYGMGVLVCVCSCVCVCVCVLVCVCVCACVYVQR